MPLVFINTCKGSQWGYLGRDVHPWVSYAASFITENGEGSFTRILESHEAATWVVCPFLQQPHSGIVTLNPKIREKEACLLLPRTAILGFGNDDGFRSYCKKQNIAPERASNDQFWSWSLLCFWDLVSATPWQCWVSLHSHQSIFQEGPSPTLPGFVCPWASPALSTQTLLTELALPLGNAGYCHGKHIAFTQTPVMSFAEKL